LRRFAGVIDAREARDLFAAVATAPAFLCSNPHPPRRIKSAGFHQKRLARNTWRRRNAGARMLSRWAHEFEAADAKVIRTLRREEKRLDYMSAIASTRMIVGTPIAPTAELFGRDCADIFRRYASGFAECLGKNKWRHPRKRSTRATAARRKA
jgi:hypothetical protein